MKKIGTYLLLLLALLSCSSKGRVIPRDEMAEVYADLFMADQWAADRHIGRQLDTVSLYAAVLERHGYEVRDYRRSVEEYIKDPDRFARIIKNSMAILEAREAGLKKERERRQSLDEQELARQRYAPPSRYNLSGLDNPEIFRLAGDVPVYVDTTAATPWNFDEQKGRDTVFTGPAFRLSARADSLSRRADSLARAHSADTLSL